MTTSHLWLAQIRRAEAYVGARLPRLYRDELIEDGTVAIDLPDGALLHVYLNDGDDPAALFADETGNPIMGLAGWSEDARNWHLTKNAFILAEIGGGDYYLLSPDAQGIARRLAVTDHEEGALHIVEEDIENPQGWRRRRVPIEQQRRARIEAAEAALGAVLPDELRIALIRDGRAPFPGIVRKDAEIVLAPDGTAPEIFQNDKGEIIQSQCWDVDDMANAQLAERGFWVFENDLGDGYLLVPDADGIARVLVIADHARWAFEIEAQAIKKDGGMLWKRVTQNPKAGVLDLPFSQKDETRRPNVENIPKAGRRKNKPSAARAQPTDAHYPALVLGLMAASFASFVLLVLGVLLAYILRLQNGETARQYSKPIRLFWWFAIGLVIAWGFKGAALGLYTQGLDALAITSMRASLVLGATAQTLFTAVCLYHSVRLLWFKSGAA